MNQVKRRMVNVVILGLSAGWLLVADCPAAALAADPGRLAQSLVALPLAFEPAAAPGAASFAARGRGYAIDIAPASTRVSVRRGATSATLSMALLGADRRAAMQGCNLLPGRTNYFLGRDSKAWRTDVPSYASLRVTGVYPDVDLVYYGNQRQVELDFVVAPGGDPRRIAMRFSGQRQVTVDAGGDLVIAVAGGELRHHRPVVYQEEAGVRRQVSGEFVLESDDTVRFRVGKYDPRRTLVIDPVLSYATYLGGSMGETGNDIAIDGAGNAYVLGNTSSADFPLLGPLQSELKGNHCPFVTKLNATGSAVVYSTYIGGGNEELGGIAVDSAGNAYITGRTWGGFPTRNAFQSTYGDGGDAFLAKLNASGNQLVFATYYGGSGGEAGKDVAVDASGNAYVVGWTESTNLQVLNAHQGALNGTADPFIAGFNASGSSLLFATYFGSADLYESANAVAVSGGDVFVIGTTHGDDFPVVNASQPAFGGGSDWWVARFSHLGGAPSYSTYLGGGAHESGEAIAVDAAANAFVAGWTSGGFPTLNPLQEHAGGNDVAVAKLGPLGQLLFATEWGGSDGNDRGSAIALDSSGNLFVGGTTWSHDLPVLNAIQPRMGGGDQPDAFVLSLGSNLALRSSTYLGGGDADEANGLAVDAGGNVYLVGSTRSANFPLKSPFQAVLRGDQDAFVVKIPAGVSPSSYLYVFPSVAHQAGIGSQWRSNVTAVNRAATAASVTLTFVSTSGETRTRAVTIGARRSVEWQDVLCAGMFDYAATASVSGSLQLLSTQPLLAINRTYNQTTAGTFGQEYPALAVGAGLAQGQTGVLINLKKTLSFRTNVGIQNLGEVKVDVRVTLHNAAGTQVGVPVTIAAEPWRWKQQSDIFQAAGAGNQDLAYATVEVVTPGGKAWAYASFIDNGTSDPTTIPVMVL